MKDNNEITKECLSLINTIIKKCDFQVGYTGSKEGFNWRNNEYKSAINDIIEYAVDKVLEVYRKIDLAYPEEIYCEDLLVLSIDNDNPKIYYLTKQIENPYDDINESIEINNKASTTTYIPLSVYNKQGYLLLGKHVGDTITYQNDGDLNEHTITILDIRKTRYSEKSITRLY